MTWKDSSSGKPMGVRATPTSTPRTPLKTLYRTGNSNLRSAHIPASNTDILNLLRQRARQYGTLVTKIPPLSPFICIHLQLLWYTLAANIRIRLFPAECTGCHRPATLMAVASLGLGGQKEEN